LDVIVTTTFNQPLCRGFSALETRNLSKHLSSKNNTQEKLLPTAMTQKPNLLLDETSM